MSSTTSTQPAPVGNAQHWNNLSSSLTGHPSLLCNALHLNNQGAVQIANGQYDDAISTLSAALVQLKQAIRCGSSAGEDDCKMLIGDNSSCRDEQDGLLRFFMSDSPSQANSFKAFRSDNRGEDDWYLYRFPIQIISTTGLKTTSDIAELISFAAIYNMGLSHHLQAISPGPTSNSRMQQRLQRATVFYEHAQRLVSKTQISRDPHMIHALVIANNLGHAHYYLGNETNGKLCFQRLLNAIVYISENRGSGTLVNSENLWDGFMENIMHHLIGKISHAAAA